MSTEAKRRGNSRYIKTRVRQFMIRCNKVTEADVIERLDSVGNVNAYVKALIRKDCREVSDRRNKGEQESPEKGTSRPGNGS